MIDTMFFLLVFFMLSSLSLSKINGLPVDLPSAKSATRQAPARLTLSLDKARKLSLNKAPVTFAALEGALRSQVGADVAGATLILNADASVPHGDVVRCLDIARQVGISRFAIAAAPQNSDISSRAP